jgi:hypothetical protein
LHIQGVLGCFFVVLSYNLRDSKKIYMFRNLLDRGRSVNGDVVVRKKQGLVAVGRQTLSVVRSDTKRLLRQGVITVGRRFVRGVETASDTIQKVVDVVEGEDDRDVDDFGFFER